MSKKSPSQYLSSTLPSDREDDEDSTSTGTATGSVGPIAAIDDSAHPDSMLGATTTTTTVDPDSKKSAKDTKEVSFQFKLYDILQREDFREIVTWLPHGLSWKIIDSEALTKTVLPKYFRHGMYSSFKRQMSGWGFRRGIKVNEYNEYSHPLFMRDKPELLSKMKRRVQKRSNKTKPSAGDIVNSNEAKVPDSISIPGQADSSLSMMNDSNQSYLGMNSARNDHGAALPVDMALMSTSQTRSALSGLYPNANQLAAYRHLYQGVGMLDGPQNDPTQLNLLQQLSTTSTLPLQQLQPLLESPAQLASNNLQMSDNMSRLANTNIWSGAMYDQLARTLTQRDSLLDARFTPGLTSTPSNIAQLEQLAQIERLRQQQRDSYLLALLRSSSTAPLNYSASSGLTQNSSTNDNAQLVNFLSGTQGPTNLDADTLEALRRAISSIRPPTQNNPNNFQG